jgi:hypothetical protein
VLGRVWQFVIPSFFQFNFFLCVKMTKADVKKKNPLIPMVAGCIAGGIEATAVWPMECKFFIVEILTMDV